MLSRLFRWTRISLLFTGVMCGVIYLALPTIFGLALQRFFEWGTGCYISFDNPQIRFNPIRISIENLVVLAPGEVKGARASRLSTGIEHISFSERQLKFMPLRIDGTVVETIGPDSSLIRIIKFVVPDADEIRATSWEISLATLFISPPDDETENLVFGWNDLRMGWKGLRFSGELLDSPPEEDTLLSATARSVRVEQPSFAQTFAGFRGRVPIRKGVLNIQEIQFGSHRPSEGKGTLRGSVLLPQGAVDLHLALQAPFSSVSKNLLLPPDLEVRLPAFYSVNARGFGLVDSLIIDAEMNSEDGEAIDAELRFAAAQTLLEFNRLSLRNFPLSLLQRLAHNFTADIPAPPDSNATSVEARVNLNLSGRVAQRKLSAVTGTLELDDLTIADNKGLKLAANIAGSDSQLRFTELHFFHPFGEIVGTAILEIADKSLELDLVAPEIKVGESTTVQQVTLRAKMPRLSPRDMEGELTVQGVRLAAGTGVIANSEPLRIRLANRALSMLPTPVSALNYSMTVGGEVSLERGWNASVNGNWTVQQLVSTPASMEQLDGVIELNLNVSGAWNAPRLIGPIRLRRGEAALRIDRTIVGVDDLEFDARFDGQDIQVESIRGHIGTGLVEGSGSLVKVLSDQREGSISLHLRDVVVEPLSDLVVEGEGDILIRVPRTERPILGGKIFLRSAVYRERFDLRRLLEIIRNTSRGSMPSSSSPNTPGSIDLDIEIAAENGLVVETDLFQSELRGTVRLDGSADKLKAAGRVEVIEGSFGLQSNRFEIVHGSLTFVPSENPLNPRLDIVSETALSSGARGAQHLVQLVVSGQVANPKVTLSSDTGLAESDILSMLTVGASIEGVSLLGGGRKVAQLSYAELLNPKRQLSFGERVSGLTGFTDLRIEEVTTLDSTESVPIVSARRSLFSGAEAVLQTQLSGRESTAARFTYELTPTIDFLAGWKNRSARDPDSTRGSFDFGFTYQQSYPGVDLFAPEVFSLE